MAERIPPGRSGRLWLVARLDTARRGRDLLDRKHQLLRREEDRLLALAAGRRNASADAFAAAQLWSMRAGIIGGAGTTANTMGVRHADTAQCDFPSLAPAAPVAGNAALAPAAAAHRHALAAAVDAAIAATALHRIEDELRATRRRLRAIERHRIPRFETSLHTLQLQLDENEREEQVTTRWARERRKNV
jgi:vacuolar-type H+-ATPase subunit D/Vma8